MILVTGAAGVIGRAVVARAEKQGLDVCAITREPGLPRSARHVACDLAAGERLDVVVQKRPSVIIHLAAAVPHSPRYPDCEASASLTRRIDECVHAAAAQWGCHVVYASTCGLYDRRSPTLKREDSDQVMVESPYFAAKLDGERRFLELGRCTVLRLSAPIGPGVPWNLVLSRFVLEALCNAALQVWGSGSREQDYVDASDLADAMLRAAIVQWRGVVNIASGQPVTMLDLAHKVSAAVGLGTVVCSGMIDARDGETARYCVDRAASVLGWRPTVSLEQSIRSLAADLSRSQGANSAIQ